jgi:hypothetical protein
MADFNAAVPETTEAAPAAPAKADTKPAAPPAAKVPEKPATKPPVAPAAKPGDKPQEKPAPVDNVAQLRKRKDELEAYEKKSKGEIAKLQEENRALQERRYVTPEIEKEIADNKAEIQRLKTQVSEVSYEHSDDFKRDYVDPWQRTLKNTLEMVDQLSTPAYTDEASGAEVPSRKTTSSDFQRVLNAPVADQAEVAQKLFGTNALRVIAQIDRLNEIKQRAADAIKSHHGEMEGKRKQFEDWQKTESQKYVGLRDGARKELAEKYPQFFAPDEADPEASDALQKGYDFVDRAAEKAHELSVDERAAYSEVIRARAAWFPRGHRELTKAKEKIASLEEELSKYRSSDPGQEKEKGRAVPAKENEMGPGLEGMTAMFDKP